MGDRCIVVVHDNGEMAAAAIYSHWGGMEMPEMLENAGNAGVVRQGDANYAAARIIGFIHESDNRSTTGLGLIENPTDLEDATLSKYSHGDGGVIVVNVDDGAVRYIGGYSDDPRPENIVVSR